MFENAHLRPLEEIREMEKLEGSEINQAKVRLAYEVTKMVHGEEEAEKAKSAAESLFGGSKDSDSIPSTEIDESFLTDGSLPILDALLESGLIPSKAEGRRLIKQGGVYVNDEKVPNFDYAIPTEQLEGDGVLIRKGKKTYHRIYVN